MNKDRANFEPVFDFDSCGSSFLLHQGPVVVSIEGTEYQGQVEARLDFSPQARICLYGNFQSLPFDKQTISSFSINGRSVEGFLVEIDLKLNPQATLIKWCPRQPISFIGDDSTQVKRVIFHLFNFANYLGVRRSAMKIGRETQGIEHVDLACDKWNVEIKSLFTTRKNFKMLKAKGGYQLTHIGCFEKKDGTSFSGKEAGEFLNALRFFLSFSKGCWCEPLCTVGFDSDDNRVWDSWVSPREAWHTSRSWFDPHNSSQLIALFPGFMKRWSDNGWHQAFREVIYWYLNANQSSRGIDAGIISTQAAIERLSYEFSVKEKKLITAKGFKDLMASDNFRLMFSSFNIPLNIPSGTPNLQSISSDRNWQDAPQALTEIRNSLVHPDSKRRGQSSDVYYDAWKLGLWYLEMSILAICGYSGTYGNRLTQRYIGQVENVPWELNEWR